MQEGHALGREDNFFDGEEPLWWGKWNRKQDVMNVKGYAG